MAKKQQSNVVYDPKTNSQLITAKPPKAIPFKDHYARINYLYQISTILQLQSKPELSRMCIKNMDAISKKTTIKLKPSLKRTVCKYCSTRLISGVTSETKLVNGSKNQNPKNNVLQIKCLQCDKVVRNFPVGKDEDYQLFSEIAGNSFPVE